MSLKYSIVWIVCLSLGLFGSVVRAQDSVPAAIKNGEIGPQQREVIESFIARQVQTLADNAASDAALQVARDRLSQEAMSGGVASSPAYLDAYSQILGQKIVPLLESDASPRQRLLAAIVVGRVSDAARNTRLLGIIQVELKDSEAPVVLWGMKGARAILPAVLNNGLLRQSGELPKEIVEAAKKALAANDAASVPIVQEAYAAATLGLFSSSAAPLNNASIESAVSLAQALLALRLEGYEKGVPLDPRSENTITLFLSHPSIWPVQSMAQKQKTAEQLITLLSFAAQRFANDPIQLASVLQQTSKAIYILTSDAALQSALSPLTRVTMQAQAAEVVREADDAYKALSAVELFKGIAQPARLKALPASDEPQ